MSIDDTNRKKVRPDRSSCRREASSDHAGACADEQAHCQRKWRFANALPATADLIVSMSHPSPDLGVSSLACHPKLAEFMRAKDGGPSGTGFATGLSTPLPSKRRTADHCSSSTRRRQPSTSPVTSASAGYFAEARRFTSSNQLITTLTCVAACSGSSCCGRRNRWPSGNTS